MGERFGFSTDFSNRVDAVNYNSAFIPFFVCFNLKILRVRDSRAYGMLATSIRPDLTRTYLSYLAPESAGGGRVEIRKGIRRISMPPVWL